MSKSPEESSELRALLRKVREIEIRSRKTAESMLSGGYRTVFKGMGIEFEEVREYIRGDDVRSIDWNVTARTGRLFVKKYREERELTVFLVVDVSHSQAFGTRLQYRKELCTEIAALLALSAVKAKDKVGMVLFSDRIERFIPPKKGRSHLLRMIRELLVERPPARGTSINEALSFINRLLKRRAIIFLISDFLDEDYRSSLRIAAGKHDLVPIVLRDPLENRLPDLGLLVLQDAETGELGYVDTSSRAFRESYSRRAFEREAALKRNFRSLNLDYLTVETGADYVGLLMNFFKRRAARY